MVSEHLLSEVLTRARYSSDRELAFKKLGPLERDGLRLLLETLVSHLLDPRLREGCIEFPNFYIPEDVLHNNARVRCFMEASVLALQQRVIQGAATVDDVKTYLHEYHQNIMWALNQWLLINPGQIREISKVDAKIPPLIRKWLQERFGVKEGATVLYRRVISHDGQNRLKDMGFTVPYDGLHEKYFREAMWVSATMAERTEDCAGVISEGSWLYNPDNYRMAPDGKPFTKFGFLESDELVGERHYVADVTPDNEYFYQYRFATRDHRRASYAQNGVFKPKVYATFYPREQLIKK